MAATRDPEQVRNLMNACFERLVPAIEKYGGMVNKFIGDEIEALLAHPPPMRTTPSGPCAAPWRWMLCWPISTPRTRQIWGCTWASTPALVIAGGIGPPSSQEYAVIGDARSTWPSRLEDASRRGDIFVGPDTYRLTASLFDFETCRPIRC